MNAQTIGAGGAAGGSGAIAIGLPAGTPTVSGQAPAASAPNAPAANAPAANAPTVNLPTVNLPTVNVPAVNVPAVNVPAVNVPDINVPAVNVPDINVPAVNVPDINVPAVSLPVVNLPSLSVPALAPLLTPGINAPSEGDLLGTIASVLPLPNLGSLPPLPMGTADVIVGQSTSAIPFGAGSTPAIQPLPAALANLLSGAVPAIPSPAAPAGILVPALVSGAIPSPVGIVGLPIQNSNVLAVVPTPVIPKPQVQAVPAAVSAILNSLPKASVSAKAALNVDLGFGVLSVPDAGTPADSPLPVNAVNPNAPVGTTPVVPTAAAAQPLPLAAALPIGTNPYSGPYPPNSIYDPTSPYYDPTAAPPGWEGQDNGIYDGEDGSYQGGKRGGKPPVYTDSPSYGDDGEEECPAWCMEDDSYPSYPTSTPDYGYSPYQPTPTPEYPDYSPVAAPYPDYEPTPEYSAYPHEYPTPSYKEEYPTPSAAYEPYPSQGGSDYAPQEPQYYPEPTDNSYSNKVRSILRAVRRQTFNWPQPANNDDDSRDYDGEDGSIPDWLYSISGAPKRPTATYNPKPTCPASCYKPKTTGYGYGTKPERPTYTMTRNGGYQTAEEPYAPEETDAPYAGYGYGTKPERPTYTMTRNGGYQTAEEPYAPEETDAPYAGYTSSAWYPQGNTTTYMWATGPTNVPDEPTYVPDEPTYVPDEPTSVPPTEATSEVPSEPTTLMTYYQPQAKPEQTGAYSDPGSPAGDYTGDTLDSLCPNVCNPFNPAENFCDITTGCTTTGGSKYYCACRAGYRADKYNAKDFSKQFRVAGQPYVYLAVSTPCNTLCSDSTCSEVLERSQCK
ncbi:hypothetical protein EJ07DRAFT_173519 [Lizonia empirigonia]|nr:hypothetical protein EJ07DRAFT_173519 [Lizonia empirigonia]